MNKKVSGQKRMYAAYGSNLHINQMEHRCPGATVFCKGELKDYELVFQGRRGNAHANVIPAEGKNVPIVIWEITKEDEAHLDIYEGVRGGYYTKEYMPIDTEYGQIECLIYVMTPNPYNFPSRYYVDVIEQGYEDFDIDVKVLDEALTVSARRMIREGGIKKWA